MPNELLGLWREEDGMSSEKPKGLPLHKRLWDWLNSQFRGEDRFLVFIFGFFAGLISLLLIMMVFDASTPLSTQRIQAMDRCIAAEYTREECLILVMGGQ